MRPIYDITPFNLSDYPGEISAIAWFCGCNMRCVYCYNSQIVRAKSGKFSVVQLLEFLKTRQNLLTAVVCSGGECTNCGEILEILRQIKALNFKIKVDTNGSKPEILSEILKRNLADFIALDFKADLVNFKKITGMKFYENFIKSLKILNENSLNFEVRTTIHTNFINEKILQNMVKILEQNNYKKPYFLQNFKLSNEHLSEISEQSHAIDISKIKTNLEIKLRNFK